MSPGDTLLCRRIDRQIKILASINSTMQLHHNQKCTSTRWHFAFALCCHGNKTHAPIAYLPNSAQPEGTP